MKRLLLILAVGAFLPAARADRRDNGPRDSDRRERGPRVIVYQHANFRGDALVLYPGDALENLADLTTDGGSRMNDSISSIRVEDGAEIYVYADSLFRGYVMRLTEDVRDLTRRPMPAGARASWNDRISSLRVAVRRREAGRGIDPDEILRKAFRDVLSREPDLAGLSGLRRMIVDQGWTAEMVRENLRQGEEFRHEGASRLIRQAYHDVLGREPHADELEHYRKILLERDWLGDDVREDLKHGSENRRNPGRR